MNTIIIGIAGGTGSGKTPLTERSGAFCCTKRLPHSGKLSPKVTDEGRTLCGNPFAGNRASSPLIRPCGATFSPRGRRLQGFFFGI